MTIEQISDLTAKCRDLQLVIKELIDKMDPVHPDYIKSDDLIDTIIDCYHTLFRMIRMARRYGYENCQKSLYTSAIRMFDSTMDLLKIFIDANGPLRETSCDKYLAANHSANSIKAQIPKKWKDFVSIISRRWKDKAFETQIFYPNHDAKMGVEQNEKD